MKQQYITMTARGNALKQFPYLRDVLYECPKGYHLHSTVPILDRDGTAFIYVIFEAVDGL